VLVCSLCLVMGALLLAVSSQRPPGIVSFVDFSGGHSTLSWRRRCTNFRAGREEIKKKKRSDWACWLMAAEKYGFGDGPENSRGARGWLELRSFFLVTRWRPGWRDRGDTYYPKTVC